MHTNNKEAEESETLSPFEVAEITGLSLPAVYKKVRNGEIPRVIDPLRPRDVLISRAAILEIQKSRPNRKKFATTHI